MTKKNTGFTEIQQEKIINNIVKIQSIEGLIVNETLQKKMFEILSGTTDAKMLAKACIEKYAGL